MKRRPKQKYPEQLMMPDDRHQRFVRLTLHEAQVLRDAVDRLWIQMDELATLMLDLEDLAVPHQETQRVADRLHNELVYVRSVVDRAKRAGVYSDHPSLNAATAPEHAPRPGLDVS